MDDRERLTPKQALKAFGECLPHIQALAERKFFQRLSIIDTTTHRVRSTYYDIFTARKVAVAVRLLETIHGISAKWSKEERRRLLNDYDTGPGKI